MEELQMIWGWQPALYLFLGGMGAGAFLAAGVLYLKDAAGSRAVVRASSWAALACLGVGLLLLLLELTNPLRGLLLWQSFSNATSWMMFGAWAALLAMIAYFAMALLMTDRVEAALIKRWPMFAERAAAVRKALVIAGMVLSAFVAVYTGMLLMSAPGVPLWNTALLPCLFTVSALDTGVALIEVVSVACAKKNPLAHDSVVLLEKAVVVLVVLEAVVLAAYVLVLLLGGNASGTAPVAAASMQTLVAGVLAPGFWGLLVACGLVLPLAMALCFLARQGKPDKLAKSGDSAAAPAAATSPTAAAVPSASFMVIGAVGAMAGGCALRFLVLMAGQHANLVADTLALLAL